MASPIDYCLHFKKGIRSKDILTVTVVILNLKSVYNIFGMK